MFKRKVYLSALCATFSALSFSSTAFAVDNGLTIGIDYGRTEAKKYCDHITNCSDSDNGPKLEVGYNFNENFAVELGYVSFGTIYDSNENSVSLSQESNAITLSLLGTVPVSEYVGLYARLGYAQYDTNNTGEVAGVPVADEDGSTPFWGAGVRFNLNEKFAIRVEYQNYRDLSNQPGRKDDVQGLFAGVNYTF